MSVNFCSFTIKHFEAQLSIPFVRDIKVMKTCVLHFASKLNVISHLVIVNLMNEQNGLNFTKGKASNESFPLIISF